VAFPQIILCGNHFENQLPSLKTRQQEGKKEETGDTKHYKMNDFSK
jgi:hypothetical protein